MTEALVNINPEVMGGALRNHVEAKALLFNSSIIYLKQDIIVKETPTHAVSLSAETSLSNNR